ncbi:hypothetical protein FA15DRAFT_671891 [Coprinopsis marcescibilis]|uniref:Uncharacterized protein n=1 Tax=Coprinopsis marcescibilis TaxID=230819 RepID=A0A5C3KQI5_COPMA|nr:hypothetical protein FA15DRAFT_671891 [Coprinopsis marcescibilis]
MLYFGLKAQIGVGRDGAVSSGLESSKCQVCSGIELDSGLETDWLLQIFRENYL